MLDKHIVLGYFSFQGRSWLLKMSSYLFIHSTNTYWIPTIILLYTLATRCEEATHWKRPWCLERLKAGEEGDDSGWDGWMASPTWWTWVWVSPGSWWWTGKPGMLRVMRSQRVGYDWVTELKLKIYLLCYKATVIKLYGTDTKTHWNQWEKRKRENPEINPCTDSQSMPDKGGRNIQWRKDSL